MGRRKPTKNRDPLKVEKLRTKEFYHQSSNERVVGSVGLTSYTGPDAVSARDRTLRVNLLFLPFLVIGVPERNPNFGHTLFTPIFSHFLGNLSRFCLFDFCRRIRSTNVVEM